MSRRHFAGICQAPFDGSWCGRRSDIEAEVHHVRFLHHVLLALEPQAAGLARPRLAPEADVIPVGDDLGAYEAALEIRMDDTGGLWRGAPAADGPGAHLLRSGGEIGDQ